MTSEVTREKADGYWLAQANAHNPALAQGLAQAQGLAHGQGMVQGQGLEKKQEKEQQPSQPHSMKVVCVSSFHHDVSDDWSTGSTTDASTETLSNRSPNSNNDSPNNRNHRESAKG